MSMPFQGKSGSWSDVRSTREAADRLERQAKQVTDANTRDYYGGKWNAGVTRRRMMDQVNALRNEADQMEEALKKG